MTDIERNWPPEMLAEVFPEQYGHLVFTWTEEAPASAPLYMVDHLPSGCMVLGLVGGQEAWRASHKVETSSRKQELQPKTSNVRQVQFAEPLFPLLPD